MSFDRMAQRSIGELFEIAEDIEKIKARIGTPKERSGDPAYLHELQYEIAYHQPNIQRLVKMIEPIKVGKPVQPSDTGIYDALLYTTTPKSGISAEMAHEIATHFGGRLICPEPRAEVPGTKEYHAKYCSTTSKIEYEQCPVCGNVQVGESVQAIVLTNARIPGTQEFHKANHHGSYDGCGICNFHQGYR